MVIYEMKIEKTFQATISLGFKEGYEGKVHELNEVIEICKKYCNDVGLCVTITPTHFVYTNGYEPGCFIGFIQYPYFPDTKENIKYKAIKLANKLMREFKQTKVSIICTDQTYTLTEA